MAAGTLTSDHVNYLIWRYLQESGHAEAAVKLQRDWLSDPQTLPFAQHIKTHALVSLIQKGLRYHQVEQSFGQTGGQKSSSAATLLFFGTEAGRASSIPQQEQIEDEKSRSSNARKHPRDSNTNGLSLDLPTPAPAAKRSRRSNGDVSTNGDRGDGDSMQIDQNGYRYQSEAPIPVSPTNYSPAEEGQTANGMDMDEDGDAPGSPASDNAPLTQTLSIGESRGIQSDKVAELGPQTNILTLSETSHVMHTAWNPKDPAILATSGKALCRLWNISRSAAFDDNPNHQNHQSYVDLVRSSYGSYVSTMAWDPTGEILAVAIRNENSDLMGAVSLWTKVGKTIDELPAAQDMVLELRWSPSGKQLLGITSSGNVTSSLALWDIDSCQGIPPYQLPSTITDAAWTSNHQLTICGNNMIASSLLEDQGIIALNTRSEPIAQESWMHIRYDSRTHTTALATDETAVLGLIDSSDTLRTIVAHESDITALAYQPVTNLSAYPASAPRLLATSSLDGSIKVWDAKRPFNLVHSLSLGHAAPAIAMSFTPDGYLVAAANWNRVLIWNAEVGGLPKAISKGVLGASPNGMLTNGIEASEEEDDLGGDVHCSLSWDAESGKLALGFGSQIAIINLRH